MRSDNPLLELSAEKQQALADLVEGRVNKRSVLKAGGAAGVLALLSQSAAGAASTSDSDGDVGEPGDLVDVFADGVDATSVSTDELTVNEGSARIFQSSGQSVSSGSVTSVSFGNEDGDYTPGDVLTVDLSNNKVTIEKPGVYVIMGSTGFSSPGDGTRVFGRIEVGGTNEDDDSGVAGDDSQQLAKPHASVAVTSSETPQDVLLKVLQDSTNSKTTSASESATHLDVVRVQ